jgi:hypothetical protein
MNRWPWWAYAAFALAFIAAGSVGVYTAFKCLMEQACK